MLDVEMHFDITNGLFNIFNKTDPSQVYYLYNGDTFNKQILFFMKMISTKDKQISDGYTNCYTEMTNLISNNTKIKITEEVIDAALAYGKQGKSTLDKRFCAFFCSQLLQIESSYNPEIIKRFVSLHSETEKIIRREVGFQMGFIAKKKDVTFFHKNFLNIIYLYLDDSDLSVRTQTIISSIKNLDRVYDDDNFLKKLIGVMIDLFEDDKIENKEYKVKATKVVKIILEESMNRIKIAQILEKVVKVIFKVKINN